MVLYHNMIYILISAEYLPKIPLLPICTNLPSIRKTQKPEF